MFVRHRPKRKLVGETKTNPHNVSLTIASRSSPILSPQPPTPTVVPGFNIVRLTYTCITRLTRPKAGCAAVTISSAFPRQSAEVAGLGRVTAMPSGYKHGDTPKKAMVRGTISYLESQGLPVNKSAIFRHFALSRSQGYAALSVPASKRKDPGWEETRGRPSKISDEDQQKMEALLWSGDDLGDAGIGINLNLNWAGLAKLAGVETECNPRTLHRTLGTLSYRRCLGCGRGWVHKKCREKRVEFSRRMLDMYPMVEDWRAVRFSCELHFGFGLDGATRLLPRPGEKYCPGCGDAGCSDDDVANDDVIANKASTGRGNQFGRDVKRVHAWAAAGYGFKSDLIFYDDSMSPTSTGTISMSDYRDKVLDKAVKTWMTPATATSGQQPFVLEEDTDSFAHGSASKVNIAQQWKEANGLRYHFSCGESPDLSPLDSLWPQGKQWKREVPMPESVVLKEREDADEKPRSAEWDDEVLRQAAREAWRALEQDRINVWVDFMTQRLREVIESEGKMVHW